MRSSPWWRSLYWRIALGLFASLALMVVAEGAIFLWLTQRVAGSMPATSPRRLAVLVASDVGAALTATPSLDLEQYVREQYGQVYQSFLVVLRDGRIASNHDDVPDDLLEAVRTDAESRRFLRGLGLGGRRGRGLGARPGESARQSGPNGPPALDANRRPRLRGEFAPIVVNGSPIGRVAVLPSGPPFARILRQLGPTVGLVAAGVLVAGAALIAFVVFGPARARIKEVQAATERVADGDFGARVPERGGDEVAVLARSFNRMADELANRARALDASDTARRHLLADVSHELMTPLTAMRGYIETLTMPEIQLDAVTRQRYLGIIGDETHRLERLIGDLLDLARLEGGGTVLRRDRVSVRSLTDRVAARHERELGQRRIRLTVGVDPGAEHVVGDADRLDQVLQNLVANALRHTPDGGEISITAAPSGPSAVIVVRDTGPGIAPAHLPSIFDRFYKADASRRVAGGSGLGLSIVKAIVERHGGTVTAANDTGAVFTVTLPAAGVPADGAAVSGKRPGSDPAS